MLLYMFRESLSLGNLTEKSNNLRLLEGNKSDKLTKK